MKQITIKEAESFGIQNVHHLMNNGELRFRLTRDTGSSYILTINTKQAAWQNSHVHHQKKEFYVVEKGWILLVMQKKDKLEVMRLMEDDSALVPVNVPHNVYISENTVLHTVKYGTKEDDWFAYPELDERIQNIDVSNWMK
ncbi:MAG: hypothetical protein IJ356_09835 [Erysipelotrichaceae bacterium]|nr:hypothetical protein [Erysipelotrichaceae bacterium]